MIKICLGASRWISKALQGPQEDLPTCVEQIQQLRKTLLRWRDGDGSGSYAKGYQDAEKLVGEVKIEQLPGARRQTGTSGNSPYDHYRIVVYIPFLDYMIAEFDRRFSKHSQMAMKLSKLLPRYIAIHKPAYSKIEELAVLYEAILPCELSSLEIQFESWCQKWANTEIDEMPKTISECLEASNATFIPGIDALLRIFATIPASVAEAERSFSALKLLKTYLRSTMTEERVSALALAYIHSDMKIDSDVIISKFAVRNRRLKFT